MVQTLTTPVTHAIRRLVDGSPLAENEAREAFRQLMRDEASPAQAAALLVGLRLRGETAAEVAGAVRALREAMVTVPVPAGVRVVDTCGTGGGTVSTFNISTAAALVAVAAGATVAKHGNRSYTSRCGSADVLEALGIDITVDAARATQLLAEAGIAFLFAPAYHPAMRFVAPVRRDLAVPTIMNMIGPLANPAGVTRQVLGVGDADRGPLMAEAARRLGAEHVLVVHGEAGMDEIAPAGRTQMWEARNGDMRQWVFDPASLGLGDVDARRLAGGKPAENAERIDRLFTAPDADPVGFQAVALNAGAALYVAGVSETLEEGVDGARAALGDGRAAAALARLRELGGVSTSA